MNLDVVEAVDAFADGGFDEDVVEGEAREGLGQEVYLGGDVEAIVEDDAFFASNGTQTTHATHEVFTGDGDFEAVGEGFEFL